MASQINQIFNHQAEQSWSPFHWLLLALVLVLTGCASGRPQPQVYLDGLKKEQAKDYKGAISDFDEAVNNANHHPRFIVKLTYRASAFGDGKTGDAGKTVEQAIKGKSSEEIRELAVNNLIQEDRYMISRVYKHRATCRKAIGDDAGYSSDMSLFETQVKTDKEIFEEIIAGAADGADERVADAAADAKKAENDKKATACVRVDNGFNGRTFTNTCDRTIWLHFSNDWTTTSTSKCSTNLLGILGSRLGAKDSTRLPADCSNVKFNFATLD